MEDWKKTLTDILQQEVTQEAMAEGNKTPEQEAVDFIEQELSKAREEGKKDTLKEIKEIMESHLENDTSTYEIIELLLNEYDGSGMYEMKDILKNEQRIRQEQLDKDVELINGIIRISDFSAPQPWFDGLRSARETIKEQYNAVK